MSLTLRIRLVHKERPSVTLPHVRVRATAGNHEATATTDSSGIAVLEFPRAPVTLRPTLRITLLSPEGQTVHTVDLPSRPAEAVIPNREHPVPVPGNALRLLFKPKVSSPADKAKDWISGWTKRLSEAPGPNTEADLCLIRILLDAVAGLDSPQTHLQRELAGTLRGSIPAQHIVAVSAAARDGRSLADRVLPGARCSSNIATKDIFDLLKQSSPEVERLYSQLTSAPRPGTRTPRPGNPFFRKVKLSSLCTGMEGDALVLDAPRVNIVDVWQPGPEKEKGSVIRSGNYNRKILSIETEQPVRTISTPPDRNDANCLLDGVEPGTNQRLFAVDVLPGQRLVLRGSGFISTAVTIESDYYRTGEDSVGRLVPDFQQRMPAASLNTPMDLQVEGSLRAPDLAEDRPETWNQDTCYFDWPEEWARPGLYRIRLHFKNEGPDGPWVTDLDFNCSTREVKEQHAESMESRPFWFVVLPELVPRDVSLHVTTVECHELTRPRFLPDEMALVSMSDITTALSPSTVTGNRQDDHGTQWFFRPDVLTWSATIAPHAGAKHALQPDQVLASIVYLSEIEGDIDRAVLRWTLLALLVALLLVLSAAVLIFCGVLLAVTSLTAAVFEVIIPLILGVLWGTVLTAGYQAARAIAASLPPGQVLVVAAPAFLGAELACSMSSVRFRRAIQPDSSGVTTQELGDPNRTTVTTDRQPTSIVQTYRAQNAGGDYSLTLRLNA